MTATASSASSASDTVDWLTRLTRVGWLSKGFVFVVIGAIAVQLAGHHWSAGAEANQRGALAVIARQPLGTWLLTLVSVGLLVFMVWNLAQAVVPGSTDADPMGIAKRIGWFGLGLFYGLVGVMGLGQAWGQGSSGGGEVGARGSSDPATLTARVLDAPGGRWLVVAVAAVVGLIGIYHARKGWRFDFLDDVDTDDLTRGQRRWLGRLGMGGFLARGYVLVVVAGFLMEAAIEYDPDEAVGLDGALRELASVGQGRILLAVTAVGFVVAGVYDMITFRRQRLE